MTDKNHPVSTDSERGNVRDGRTLKERRRETLAASYESDILKALFVSTIVPLVLLEVSTAGSSFVDGLVVSQFLGAQALAVQGLASPYYSITGIVGGLLVTGMQTLSGKAYGAGDVKRAEGYYSLAIIVGGAISIALALVFLLASGPIGEALGATGESAQLLPDLEVYLHGLGIGTPAIVLFSLMIPIVQMNGGGHMVRVATAVGLVVNAAIDVLAGVFGWGMLGIGLATSLSSWAQYILLLVHSVRSKSSVHVSVKNIVWSELGEMVAMGLPKAIRRVANMLRPVFLNHLVLALGGAAAMSSMSIRNSLDGIGDVVGSGIAGAVVLMVAVLYGEENRDGIMQVCRLTVKYISLVVGAVSLAFFVFAPWLADLYAKGDAEVVGMATFAIRCMAVNLLLNALIEAYINFLQATGQTLKTHIVNVASRFACVVTCAFVLGNLFGINGVWLAFPVGSTVLILACVGIAMVRKRSVRIGPDDILGLRTNFGASSENTLWYNITSEAPDFFSAPDDVYELCERQGLSRAKAFRTSLCLEEMVGNIVQHGFTSDDKRHSIDVRIVAKDGNLILRVRDDCELFNVRKKGEAWKQDPDDVCKNFGIRMTMREAKNLQYVTTLGTNTLLITV